MTPGRRVAILCLVAAFAVGAGAYRYLQTMPVGTGETRASPDGRFTAAVADWSGSDFFTGAPRRWFEFTLEGDGIERKWVSEPVAGPYFGSRSSQRVIQWKSDSSAVEFAFPGRSLRMETGALEDDRPHWSGTGEADDAPG